MEHARLLLAILLTFAVFALWQWLFVEPQAPAPPAPQTAQEDTRSANPPQPDTISNAPAPAVNAIPAPAADIAPTPSGREARQIHISTPLADIILSEKGAGITALTLKKYHEAIGADAPGKVIIGEAAEGQNLLFSLEDVDQGKSLAAVYQVQTAADRIDVQDKSVSVEFDWVSQDGIEIRKRYTFQPDSYLIDLEIAVKNRGASTFQSRSRLMLVRKLEEGGRKIAFEGPEGLIDKSLKEIKVKDDAQKVDVAGLITWIGITSRYFMINAIPTEPVTGSVEAVHFKGGLVKAALIDAESVFSPGQEKIYKYRIFAGPKSAQLLNSYGYQLSKSINFGWFDFLAKPFLWIMNQIYRVIPNYGVAIILLTAMTKIVLWPLGAKSYKSMNQMKRMQPLMAEIREKYKNDKKKMNEEMMGLYRTYKVNPMGGCLPMVLQLPVFLALYNMLYGAIELRHAPFMLWINDLSAPDRLFHFGFNIPFMNPPAGIPVLTIIMGATMFLQQKMTPTPGDPSQAKIMMFMPLIFTVIFINFPSGLVLYWLVNNILSMGQQFFTQKKAQS